MASIEEIDNSFELPDSGMGSSDARSPETKPMNCFDDDDEEDETLVERLIGLTEMFPKQVRNFGHSCGSCLVSSIKGFYSLSCTTMWLMVSSSIILIAPVFFEVERARTEDALRHQQKQVLLGPSPNASYPGSPSPPMPPSIPR